MTGMYALETKWPRLRTVVVALREAARADPRLWMAGALAAVAGARPRADRAGEDWAAASGAAVRATVD